MTIISLQELRVFFWDRYCDKSSGFDSSKPAPATHLSLNSSTNPWPCANISSRDSRQSCWSLHWVFLESVYLTGGQLRNKIGSPLWQRHEERSKRLELWCEVRCRPQPKLRESKKVISDKISLIPLLLRFKQCRKIQNQPWRGYARFLPQNIIDIFTRAFLCNRKYFPAFAATGTRFSAPDNSYLFWRAWCRLHFWLQLFCTWLIVIVHM